MDKRPSPCRARQVVRIHAHAVTNEAFAVAAAFGAKRYEAEGFRIAWEKPMTVVVRFSAEQTPCVREREWHPTQRICVRRDRRVELTFRAGGTFETAFMLGRAAATYRQCARTPNDRGRAR